MTFSLTHVGTMKARIDWLDTAKGIGIILVVLGHISPRKILIYSFHMPLFFFLAGCLFDEARYAGSRDFLVRMTKTRVVPYLSFCVMSFFMLIIKVSSETRLSMYQVLSIDNFRPMVLEKVYAIMYANGTALEKIGNVALWFLPCLFVAEVLFFFIPKKQVHGIPLFGTCVGASALLGIVLGVQMQIKAPWSIETACIAVLFYYAGHRVRTALSDGGFRMPAAPWAKAAVLVSAFVVAGTFAALNGRVDMNSSQYGNMAFFFIAAFAGIAAVVIAVQMLPEVGPLVWLGRNSLIIFGLHLPFVAYSREVLNVIASVFTDKNIVLHDDVYVSLVTLMTILLSSILAYVINRYAPFIVGRGYRHGLDAASIGA